MHGIAQQHYPQIVWREGEKRLWNPIHRKALKNRPEERVRLRIIEALVQAGWSKHRISTEEKLRPANTPGGRTDIICYDRDFNPKILVECKAERISISTEVAEQTARYNRTVEAPYLLMTNGLTDYWYRMDGGQQPERLDTYPELLEIPAQQQEQDFTYWKERGFAGDDATGSGLRNWLTLALNTLWLGPNGNIRYLEFTNSPSDLNLNHYFHISQNRDNRLALGILSTPFGNTRMAAVINRNGQNVGLIEINLDLVSSDASPNSTVYSKNLSRNFDIRERMPLDLNTNPDIQQLRNILSSLDTTFDEMAG